MSQILSMGMILLLCSACLPQIGLLTGKTCIDSAPSEGGNDSLFAQSGQEEFRFRQVAPSQTEVPPPSDTPSMATSPGQEPKLSINTESKEDPDQNIGSQNAPGNKSDRFMPIVINERVEQFIQYFQTKLKSQFSGWLARSAKYIPLMKIHLKENGVPEDLVYLALIESGFNPYAYSRAKASGPWQFISLTGKRYGLQANGWVDERRDPEKSTIAAARYLKDLYDLFECWYLAVAGYNAGETRIATAVKRYGTGDFWELTKYRDLKQETKDYVPQIIAAAVIAGDPVQYGFTGIEYEEPLCYEKVPVPEITDLRLIARACKVSIEDLQSLNPELLRGYTPPNASNYEVKIPCGRKELFLNNFEALRPLKRFQLKTHVVKKGDTLSRIAKSYGVKVAPIQEINQLKKATHLSVGMNLLIPVPMSEGGSSNLVGKKELNGKKENRGGKVS